MPSFLSAAKILVLSILTALGLISRPAEEIKPSASPAAIQIIFAGDLFFDRHLRLAVSQNGFDYPLLPLQELLLSADLAVVNLESPITVYPSVSLGSVVGSPANYRFTSPPETAAALARNNLKVVNLGNNHILNFGQDGLNQTTGFLDEAGVSFFGNTGQAGDPSLYLIKPIGKLIFGFVNYNQFVAGGKEGALND